MMVVFPFTLQIIVLQTKGPFLVLYKYDLENCHTLQMKNYQKMSLMMRIIEAPWGHGGSLSIGKCLVIIGVS